MFSLTLVAAIWEVLRSIGRWQPPPLSLPRGRSPLTSAAKLFLIHLLVHHHLLHHFHHDLHHDHGLHLKSQTSKQCKLCCSAAVICSAAGSAVSSGSGWQQQQAEPSVQPFVMEMPPLPLTANLPPFSDPINASHQVLKKLNTGSHQLFKNLLLLLLSKYYQSITS